jgi:hypothetical protein
MRWAWRRARRGAPSRAYAAQKARAAAHRGGGTRTRRSGGAFRQYGGVGVAWGWRRGENSGGGPMLQFEHNSRGTRSKINSIKFTSISSFVSAHCPSTYGACGNHAHPAV